MAIAWVRGGDRSRDGHRWRDLGRGQDDGLPAPGSRWRTSAAVGLLIADDAGHHVAFDELLLAARGLPQRGGGKAVDLAQARAGRLVQRREGVGGEDLAVSAGPAEPELHVLGGVVDDHGPDGEPALDARVEGAVLAQLESVLEVGEAHEDERQERSTVPFVVWG